MHNKSRGDGWRSFCSAGTVCDCASVVETTTGTPCLISIALRLLGMLAFAMFMWLIISMAKEPTASWVLTNLKLGTNFGVLGIGVILYLMYAEYEIGKSVILYSCAHRTYLQLLVSKLSNVYGSSDWNVAGNSNVVDVAIKSVESVAATLRQNRLLRRNDS